MTYLTNSLLLDICIMCIFFASYYQYHWHTSLCINVFYMSHYFFRRDSTMEIIDVKNMAIRKPFDIIDSLLFPNVPADIPPWGMPIFLHSVTIWYLLILAELRWLSLPEQDHRISSSVSPWLSTSPKIGRVAQILHQSPGLEQNLYQETKCFPSPEKLTNARLA